MEENKNIQAVDSMTVSATKAGQQMNEMMAFANKWLKDGEDYAKIAGSKKPSLLKSGAEKMNILMGLRPSYTITTEIRAKDDQFYYVQVKCQLKDKTGDLIADCIGSCNNKEKARQNVDFYDCFNPVLKMAEKRAFVGATLHANALSQMYTQDIEDTPELVKRPLYACSGCDNSIPDKVAQYSKEKYGKFLCMDCQKNGK